MTRLFDKRGAMPTSARVMAVLWLSFLMAVPAAGLLFSVVDPLELQYCVDLPTLSRLGAYTIGFFLFWSLTAATGLLCVFFVHE